MANRERNERIQIMLSSEELRAIDDFRYSNRLPTRAAAFREIIATWAQGRRQESVAWGSVPRLRSPGATATTTEASQEHCAKEATMTARQLIDGASFGPDTLKALGQAFDEAWQEIAPNFGDEQQEIDAARLRLANAVLSIADEDSRDVEVLKRAALQRMALDYRLRDDLDFAKPLEAESRRENI